MSACNEIFYLLSNQVLVKRNINLYKKLGNDFHLVLGNLRLKETLKFACLLRHLQLLST